MKKLSCLFICAFFAFILTGCGNTSTLTCTKTSTEDGMETKENIKVTFEKDKPSKAEMSMDMKFDDDTKDYIDLTYNMLDTALESVEQDGLVIDKEKTDDSIRVKLNVDFSKVESTEELDFSIDSDENKETIKNDFESDGYECK